MYLQSLIKIGHNRCSININWPPYFLRSQNSKKQPKIQINVSAIDTKTFSGFRHRYIPLAIYINRASAVANFDQRLYCLDRSNVSIKSIKTSVGNIDRFDCIGSALYLIVFIVFFLIISVFIWEGLLSGLKFVEVIQFYEKLQDSAHFN